MDRFIDWSLQEAMDCQLEEFKLRFRRFKQKQSEPDSEQVFVNDSCEILEKSKEFLAPLLETWIGTISYEEYEKAFDSAIKNNSSLFLNNSIDETFYKDDKDINSRIFQDAKGKPLITTMRTFNLFIGDMPLETTEMDLKTAFSHFGNIVKVRLMQKGSKQLAFGFIHFKDSETLHRAIKEQPIVNLHGKKCRCGPSQERVTLYFSNLPLQITQQDLLALLEKHIGKGLVASIDIKCGPPPEFVSRQFGFVQFVDQTTCELVRKQFTNEVIKLFDQPINVAPAENFHQHEDFLVDVTTMFISNVASDISDESIKTICGAYGPTTRWNFSRRDRGYVYVVYVNREDCLKAIKEIHNTKMGSQYVSAAIAKPKAKPTSMQDSRMMAHSFMTNSRDSFYSRPLYRPPIIPFGAVFDGYGRGPMGSMENYLNRGMIRRDSRSQLYDSRQRDHRHSNRSGRSSDKRTPNNRSREQSNYKLMEDMYRYDPYSAPPHGVALPYDASLYPQYQAYFNDQTYRPN